MRRVNITGDEEMDFARLSITSLSYEDLCKLSDAQLVQHVAARCPEALTVLFDRYHRLVFDVALRIVRDPGEAEEVVQTVFLDVYRAVANFDSRKGTYCPYCALGFQFEYHQKRFPTSPDAAGFECSLL